MFCLKQLCAWRTALTARRATKISTGQRRHFLGGLLSAPFLAQGASPEPAASTQEPPRHFTEVIGYKIEEHIRTAQFAILPLGSVEYHGPSGPVSTDTVLAKGLADRLAPKFKATIFPCIEFTHNPAHTAAFRGSVSVRPDVLTMYFEDVLRGIYQNGFKKIFVLNGHSGNIAPMRSAISQVAGELKGSDMLLVNWWETLSIQLVESLNVFSPGSNGGRGHGGPLEMSSAAVFAPNSIEAGRAPDLPPTPRPEDGTPYYHEKEATEDWPAYSGKLSEISRERGVKLVDAATNRLETLLEHWLKNGAKAGNW